MHRIPCEYRPGADALAGRVILVTGAGGGIGRAMSESLAAHGATVVLLGRRVAPLEAAFDAIVAAGGREPAIVPLDLAAATPENYAELAECVETDLGRLDGLVHNAAHLQGLRPFRNVAAEEWYRAHQVNVAGPYLMTQCLLPLLRASDAGRIVFSLEDASRTTRAYWGAYGVSKAAAEGLMRILADELASTSVRVCGVRPAPTRTALRARVWAAEDPSTLPGPAERARAFLAVLDPGNAPGAGMVYPA